MSEKTCHFDFKFRVCESVCFVQSQSTIVNDAAYNDENEPAWGGVI